MTAGQCRCSQKGEPIEVRQAQPLWRFAPEDIDLFKPCSRLEQQRHGLKRWLKAAKKRLHYNVLAVALANKLARIAWNVLARGRAFEDGASMRRA